MKKYLLLSILMLASLYNFAGVVQGNVVDMSSAPVTNQIVHVTDSSNGVQIFSLLDTTDALGNYSITLPQTVPTGAFLHIFTEKCGMVYTNNQTYSTSTIIANFTVCGTTNTGSTVSGTVTLGATTNPANPAIVYLIKKMGGNSANSYTLTLLDSTNTSSNGEYHFYNITVGAGDLLVKAALLPTNSNYSNYLPTYKENSLTWNNALAVSFTLGANNIHMVAGVNPGGPGFIGGSVLQGANKPTGVGDPLYNRILLLTTINDVGVAYTYSDGGGNFSFPNLAYGTYKIFGDDWGKLNPPLLITINAANPSVNNIVFEENTNDYSGHIGTTAVSNVPLNELIKVYPNPASDFINIEGMNQIIGVKSITMSTMNGTVIYKTSTNANNIQIPMNELAKGIYIMSIQTSAGKTVIKVSK